MNDAGATLLRHLHASLSAGLPGELPFRHWTVTDVLPRAACMAVLALPFGAPDMAGLPGRREAINAHRTFFGVPERAAFQVCDSLAEVFQAPATVSLLQRLCGAQLQGASLRIEYCQDSEGFWLEPHTDIGAKLFTMLIYLSRGPKAASWGTDLLDAHGQLAARTSGAFNTGLIFVPAADTWHAFERRPIEGVRRTLIINYVRREWQSRHELAFPGTPVAAKA